MPAWLSAIVEKALRPTDDINHDESWATPTHVIGAEAVEANGDVCSDYASDLVGLLVDEVERLRAALCKPCNFCTPCGECEACARVHELIEGRAARAAGGGE